MKGAHIWKVTYAIGGLTSYDTLSVEAVTADVAARKAKEHLKREGHRHVFITRVIHTHTVDV